MCAEARLGVATTHDGLGPQYTRTNASCAGLPGFCSTCVAALRTARYTEYSVIRPAVFWGGSQDKCAPSGLLLILIADGAPGKPGRHVLNAEISLNGPRPQALMPATRNLYAVPGSNSCRFRTLWSGTLTTSMSCKRPGGAS
ncbi:hypothetical protein NP493_1g10012 [Ridgeia piscesae]|uniref:Uncharacterized protein n=1 Tax=Ridgeia piscesae TaxID=27915 RepID=A0AAD9ULV5_RIDPI|nr:hypothetical protein NP493_1g10012 [Ridgeia piscesae]